MEYSLILRQSIDTPYGQTRFSCIRCLSVCDLTRQLHPQQTNRRYLMYYWPLPPATLPAIFECVRMCTSIADLRLGMGCQPCHVPPLVRDVDIMALAYFQMSIHQSSDKLSLRYSSLPLVAKHTTAYIVDRLTTPGKCFALARIVSSSPFHLRTVELESICTSFYA
jgi:hypothetical protein